MVKVIIEMDGEKVFEQEREFVHFIMGTAVGDGAYDAVGGLVGVPKPGALPKIFADSYQNTVKELCGDEKKAYLSLLANLRREINKILDKEIAENMDAVGEIVSETIGKILSEKMEGKES